MILLSERVKNSCFLYQAGLFSFLSDKDEKMYLTNIMSQVNSPTFTEKFVASVYLVMFIVGFTANLLVIIVLLLTSGSLKAPAGLYVLHLAVADSLLLISLPFAADNRLRGTWIFGRIACKIMESMKLLNFFSSIFLLTLMGKKNS